MQSVFTALKSCACFGKIQFAGQVLVWFNTMPVHDMATKHIFILLMTQK